MKKLEKEESEILKSFENEEWQTVKEVVLSNIILSLLALLFKPLKLTSSAVNQPNSEVRTKKRAGKLPDSNLYKEKHR